MINTITRVAAGFVRGLLVSLVAVLPVAAQSPPTDLGSLTVQNALNSLATPQANDLVALYRGQNGVLNFSRYSAGFAPSIIPGTTVVTGAGATPNCALTAGPVVPGPVLCSTFIPAMSVVAAQASFGGL